jgi:hypothetical protein
MKISNKNRSALLASLFLDESTQIRVNTIWTKYETGLHLAIKANGKRHTLERYKECYTFLRNIVLNLPTQPIPFCKVDKRGIPKPLWPLRSLIKGDRNDMRIALCIARSYEQIKLPIDYSVESIEAPSHYGSGYQETKQQFKIFLTEFTNKYDWYLGSLQTRNSYEPDVFTTLSKGPNGPAVASAHLDAKAVVSDLTLFSNIKKLNQALKQDWITEWMIKMSKSVTDGKTYLTGRLGFSAEPAGKTRIFAIGDYWSQTSLKVIQTSLYNTLKSISTDATRDQNKGFTTLMEESNGKDTYSFDLSSASDRIPAEMQVYRLELMGGKTLGEAWLSVMTDRTFLIKATKQSVRWSVGQPLGLLSSFPSFALWHHDIIQFAYYRCRMRKGSRNPIKFFKEYRLLGDDVVIFNKEVASEYQFLMTDIFDIKINMSKSVIGDSKNSQLEFAKRLALRGREMSSIKHNILSKNNLRHMLDLVDILYERDFISKDTCPYWEFRFLSSKDRNKLNFVFWTRSNCDAPFKDVNPKTGNITVMIDRETFNNKLKELRLQNLQEKAILVTEALDKNISLDNLCEKYSVPYTGKALGLASYADAFELHPLVWAVNQTGLDLSIKLSTIWDEQDPDVSPVEYLPVVSNESYFSKPKTGRVKFLSELILDVYTNLKDELQICEVYSSNHKDLDQG